MSRRKNELQEERNTYVKDIERESRNFKQGDRVKLNRAGDTGIVANQHPKNKNLYAVTSKGSAYWLSKDELRKLN